MSNVKMPDPVAWSILDKRTSKHWYTNESKYTCQGYANIYSHRESDGSSSMEVTPLTTTEQAEAYAQARVDEVASVAIGALKESLCGQLGEIEQRDIVDDVASAIRALKEQSNGTS